jgi:hypothetical protein
LYVSPTTLEDAPQANTEPISSTYVLSVEAKHTLHQPNCADSIANRVVTPYNADAFEHLLHKFNLTSRYPDLVYNIRNGFPISNMPILTHSYTPPPTISQHSTTLQ